MGIMQHIVVFSHGFGVRKDARGMFTDIAAGLPYVPVLFDYNTIDVHNNTHVPPLTDQAHTLQDVLARTRQANPHATIDLIAHSQGCIVAGLAKPQGLRKIVLLAPPKTLSAQRIIDLFGTREGTVINQQGVSKLARRDGTTTILSAAYWQSLATTDPQQLYNGLAARAPTTVVVADRDEVLGEHTFNRLSPAVTVRHLAANHDFAGPARSKLITLIRQELL